MHQNVFLQNNEIDSDPLVVSKFILLYSLCYIGIVKAHAAD